MNQTLTVTGLTSMNGGLTINGPLTQSAGNATINGGANNVFGSVGGSNNTIGAAGSTNTFSGQNNFNGNINQTAGSTTLLNTQVNGTLGSTGNITLATASSNNSIGNAGAINTITGATNNLTATTNNVTGDFIQISGRAAIAPSAGTTNSFGTGASQTNNISTGASTTTTIGNGSGNVNNIGTASGVGNTTNNIGNTNVGTFNNLSGLTTVRYTGDQSYLVVAGGAPSTVGPFPTSAQSELLVNGDGWFDGTLAAARLNIFGAGPSCISNLATVNFSSCAGGVTPINLVSSIAGTPAGTVDITGIRNIQATNSVQTNTTLTIGTTGTNATNITSTNPGPAAINQQTPSVSGRIPTLQTYILNLAPATGPNGGGAVTVNAGSAPGLNFDINDAIMVNYRSHNVGFPTGQLWVTSMVPGVSFVVESSAAGDNNTVTITILRD